MSGRSTSRLVLAAVPLLAFLAPPSGGPTGSLLVPVSLLAWACTGWLALVALLTWGCALPGAPGRDAARLLRRVAPAPVRGLVRVAVGASLAASVLTGPAALAEDRSPTVAGSASDALDWPGLAPIPAPAGTAAPAVPSPSAAAVVAAPAPARVRVRVDAHPRPSVAPPPSEVVVHTGDSLWAIAQRELGTAATQRQVARAWPRWWSANRDVIGDDPDVIHPGDRLTAP
jgi:nucleoid-associated protein YgaU